MRDQAYLQDFPLEVRQILIKLQEMTSVVSDERYRVALIHQRQRLVNRFNDFVESDRRAAAALEAGEEDSTITTPETINV